MAAVTGRHVMATEGGGEVAFHGEYREIVPSQRIVYTEVFEGTPDPTATSTGRRRTRSRCSSTTSS